MTEVCVDASLAVKVVGPEAGSDKADALFDQWVGEETQLIALATSKELRAVLLFVNVRDCGSSSDLELAEAKRRRDCETGKWHDTNGRIALVRSAWNWKEEAEDKALSRLRS